MWPSPSKEDGGTCAVPRGAGRHCDRDIQLLSFSRFHSVGKICAGGPKKIAVHGRRERHGCAKSPARQLAPAPTDVDEAKKQVLCSPLPVVVVVVGVSSHSLLGCWAHYCPLFHSHTEGLHGVHRQDTQTMEFPCPSVSVPYTEFGQPTGGKQGQTCLHCDTRTPVC